MTKSDYKNLNKSIDSLLCALKHKDLHTQLHSKRVVGLTHEIGMACHLSESELSTLYVAAYCHDIGKIGIPDKILLKPSRLNEDEWHVMKTHAEKGEDILTSLHVGDDDRISRAVRHHHENYDGTGYPDKISGEDINIYARIISVADCYDAITVSRPYQNQKYHVEAMAIISSESNVKFDPYILNKFQILINNSPFKSTV